MKIKKNILTILDSANFMINQVLDSYWKLPLENLKTFNNIKTTESFMILKKLKNNNKNNKTNTIEMLYYKYK